MVFKCWFQLKTGQPNVRFYYTYAIAKLLIHYLSIVYKFGIAIELFVTLESRHIPYQPV